MPIPNSIHYKLFNPTPTLALPLKGREIIIFLSFQRREIVMFLSFQRREIVMFLPSQGEVTFLSPPLSRPPAQRASGSEREGEEGDGPLNPSAFAAMTPSELM
jgi:hypothetical protein